MPPNTYTPEEDQFIRDNIDVLSFKEIAEQLTAKFGTCRTDQGVRARCHKILKIHRNNQYTDEQKEWLKENGPYHRYSETTKLFNQRFKTNKTEIAIKSMCRCLGIYLAREVMDEVIAGIFDKKMVDKETIWVDERGYSLIKVDDRNAWMRLSHYIWEKHNGPIPDGYVITYLDGDNTNNDISNLACVPSKYVVSLYHNFKTESKHPEITKTKIKYLDLRYAIKDHEP